MTRDTRLPAVVLDADNLPVLPDAAVEILAVTRDEDAGLAELAAAIGRDAALTERLLRVANTTGIHRAREVTSIERAAMQLGVNTVQLLSLGFSLVESLPRSGAGPFDYDEFWRRSLVTAVAARSLARRAGSPRAEEAFLCGLLSRVGQLVLADCLPELYRPVLDAAGPEWPCVALERELLGFDHGDVTAELLCQWQLPALIYRPIALLHGEPVAAADAGDVRTLGAVLAVARDVARLTGDREKGVALRRLRDGADDLLGIAPKRLDRFVIELEAEVDAVAELLRLEVAPTSHQAILDRARAELIGLDDDGEDGATPSRRGERDAATGVATRRAFDAVLARHVRARMGHAGHDVLGLLLFDVDRLTEINETFGRAAGDHVLRRLGTMLERITRSTDYCARFGGEEFVILVPSTSPERLAAMARRLREAIVVAETSWEGQWIEVTCSVGGACLRCAAGQRDGDELVRLVERQVDLAKARGRNRCELDGEPLAGF